MQRGVRIAAAVVLAGLVGMFGAAVVIDRGGFLAATLFITGLPWSVVALGAATEDTGMGTITLLGLASTAVNVALVVAAGRGAEARRRSRGVLPPADDGKSGHAD
ncbi:MAG: hypothetical protein QOE45_3267 [Frankiaceae bacterium]|jgi:hypothetical protein|nr:hypothetical protein [Frankiaceae bacterium]